LSVQSLDLSEGPPGACPLGRAMLGARAEYLSDARALTEPDSEAGVLQLRVEEVSCLTTAHGLPELGQHIGFRIAQRNPTKRQSVVWNGQHRGLRHQSAEKEDQTRYVVRHGA